MSTSWEINLQDEQLYICHNPNEFTINANNAALYFSLFEINSEMSYLTIKMKELTFATCFSSTRFLTYCNQQQGGLTLQFILTQFSLVLEYLNEWPAKLHFYHTSNRVDSLNLNWFSYEHQIYLHYMTESRILSLESKLNNLNSDHCKERIELKDWCNTSIAGLNAICAHQSSKINELTSQVNIKKDQPISISEVDTRIEKKLNEKLLKYKQKEDRADLEFNINSKINKLEEQMSIIHKENSSIKKDISSLQATIIGNKSELDQEFANTLSLLDKLKLFDELKTNTTLISLDLSFCNIGNIEVGAISQALKSNNNLKDLKLNDNLISDSGAISLSQALKINKFLKYLDISNNNMGEKGSNAIKQAFSNPEKKLIINQQKASANGGESQVALEEVRNNEIKHDGLKKINIQSQTTPIDPSFSNDSGFQTISTNCLKGIESTMTKQSIQEGSIPYNINCHDTDGNNSLNTSSFEKSNSNNEALKEHLVSSNLAMILKPKTYEILICNATKIIVINRDEISFEDKSQSFSVFPENCRYCSHFNTLYVSGGMIRKQVSALSFCMKASLVGSSYKVTIKNLPNMNNPRDRHCLIYLENLNSIVACGGFFQNKTEMLNLDNSKWESLPDLKEERANSTIGYINQRYIYLFGGYRKDQKSIENGIYLNNSEYLDAKNVNQGWTFIDFRTKSLKTISLCAMGIISLNASEILLCGGFDGTNYKGTVGKATFDVETGLLTNYVNEQILKLPATHFFLSSNFTKIGNLFINFDSNTYNATCYNEDSKQFLIIKH